MTSAAAMIASASVVRVRRRKLTPRCIRRFSVKADGSSRLVEVVRQIVVARWPPKGSILTFQDGTGEAEVVIVHIPAWPFPAPRDAVLDDDSEIRMGTEPGDRLPRALAGWTLVADAATAPVER